MIRSTSSARSSTRAWRSAASSFEPADRLIGEAAHLGELPADRPGLGLHAVADRVLDPSRKRGLDVGGQLGEGLDLGARPLERGVDLRRLDAALGRLLQALLRTGDRDFVHPAER